MSKKPVKQQASAAAGTASPATATAETAPFLVRGGFTLHLGKRVFKAGQIVDLTEAEANARRHQVELAPEQVEE
ncbi:MAG: hypothetical protein POG24_09110 [Acidocella sp.]|nr:hypothetical protein [Acidocella sp.]MDE8350212.1 hypothetical protein [Acidocella sp.]